MKIHIFSLSTVVISSILVLHFASFCGALGSKRVNLTNGASCVYSHNCASNCCDLGFDGDDTLGTYCFASTYCTSELKNPGQSCAISNECDSKCCEDTICQKNPVCFNKYVLPFVIVFGVLVVFLVAAIIILVLYKRKMRRAKMLKRLDDKAKSMLSKLGVKLPTNKGEGLDEIKTATIQPDDLKPAEDEDYEGPAETHRGNSAEADENLISKTPGEEQKTSNYNTKDADDVRSNGTRRASVQSNLHKDISKTNLL